LPQASLGSRGLPPNVTVQASAVRRRLAAGQVVERQALEAVEATGREALAEMRRMVGVLRQPDADPELVPKPGSTRSAAWPRRSVRQACPSRCR
jgi:Histidine kinase